MMAEILEFRAPPRSEHEVEKRYAESAQILFFTGVRYMRMDDADAIRLCAREKRASKSIASKSIASEGPGRSSKPTAPRRNPRKRA